MHTKKFISVALSGIVRFGTNDKNNFPGFTMLLDQNNLLVPALGLKK